MIRHNLFTIIQPTIEEVDLFKNDQRIKAIKYIRYRVKECYLIDIAQIACKIEKLLGQLTSKEISKMKFGVNQQELRTIIAEQRKRNRNLWSKQIRLF